MFCSHGSANLTSGTLDSQTAFHLHRHILQRPNLHALKDLSVVGLQVLSPYLQILKTFCSQKWFVTFTNSKYSSIPFNFCAWYKIFLTLGTCCFVLIYHSEHQVYILFFFFCHINSACSFKTNAVLATHAQGWECNSHTFSGNAATVWCSQITLCALLMIALKRFTITFKKYNIYALSYHQCCRKSPKVTVE